MATLSRGAGVASFGGMGPSLREIPLHRTTNLELYRDLDHLDPLLARLRERGRALANRLGTCKVWMLNSAATGGGVAEMMPRVCSLLADLGIDTRWLVLEPGRPDFFRITKQIHNLLHGESSTLRLQEARGVFEDVARAAAAKLHPVSRNDLLVVHDPQPCALPIFLPPSVRPRLIWRSHVGVSERNEWTEAAWAFLRPYLGVYERLIFSSPAYIPDEWRARSAVLQPGIDPLAHKNRSLRPYKLVGILTAAGLAEGPEPPAWARFASRAQRYAEGGWAAEPIPALLHTPLIVQISRFDRLKGFQYLIPAFERLVHTHEEQALHVRADAERAQSELSRAQLVLAGPDPAGVADDPEAEEVLRALCEAQAALPKPLRERVHLLRLPMAVPKENALMVNGLQRVASVVVQNSIREGFGLTAAEAMWKATPVIAANVGGLAAQIRDGTDGLLIQRPDDPAELAAALARVLSCPLEAERLGRVGRARVRDHFLVLGQVERWIGEIEACVSAPRPAG
jgi:trehalose synthase